MTLPTPDCQHQEGEDCMTCRECGVCREDLDEDDLCPECKEQEQGEGIGGGRDAGVHSDGASGADVAGVGENATGGAAGVPGDDSGAVEGG